MNNSFARNLLISTVLYIIFAILVYNSLEKELILLAVFLAIPLLLFLVPTTKRNGSKSRYYSLLTRYHPYAAITIGLAFIFPIGPISGALSIPWSIYLLALAGYGFRRILERGWHILEENAIDIGFIYACIGGIWLSIYCFGGNTLSYPASIVLLTAIHFHFSAIFAPVFMGLLGRILPMDQKIGHVYRWSTIGMMISPLLVAIGIAVGHWLEFIAVLFFATCLFMYSYLVVIHISKTIKRFIVRSCLQLSAFVIVVTILLSIIYSLASLLGKSWLNAEQMIWFHGIANAIGFILLGLFGWVYLRPEENITLYGLPQTDINGDEKIGKDFFHRKDLVWQNQHHAGLVDNLERFARNDFFPTQIHPKIRSFYENTILYNLAAQITWHRSFRPFAKLYKNWASKIEQVNLPIDKNEVIQIDGKIISIRDEQNLWRSLRGWIRTYTETDNDTDEETNKAMFAAVYADYQADNEQYLHITLPIPKWNVTGILRLEHGADLSLQITSLPRRGRKGDEGIYLMIKNFSIRLPLNEHFLIWVDEYGRLQATHRMWLFGMKLLSIEYEISGKVR